MMHDKLTFLVLDYNRPKELELCIKSIHSNTDLEEYQVLLLSNGGIQEAALGLYKYGLIDTLILNKKNNGCGLGTRQVFNSSLSEYVVYVQSDQFLNKKITKEIFETWKKQLESFFYIDLAGNQGHGNYSERAHLIKRSSYVTIPGLENIIGGPGPYADKRWTENFLQEYIKKNDLKIYHDQCYFVDNGKVSIREYPCGGIVSLMTDTKQLFIHVPIKQRVDFPNLLLTDDEWDLILTNRWAQGTVPKQYNNSSFLYWQKPYEISDFK